jgi:hypothetical protein
MGEGGGLWHLQCLDRLLRRRGCRRTLHPLPLPAVTHKGAVTSNRVTVQGRVLRTTRQPAPCTPYSGRHAHHTQAVMHTTLRPSCTPHSGRHAHHTQAIMHTTFRPSCPREGRARRGQRCGHHDTWRRARPAHQPSPEDPTPWGASTTDCKGDRLHHEELVREHRTRGGAPGTAQ